MAKFLFQPDPIDGVRFKSIEIDVHKAIHVGISGTSK